jgi:metallophosphoesterase (TIGR03767 family)
MKRSALLTLLLVLTVPAPGAAANGGVRPPEPAFSEAAATQHLVRAAPGAPAVTGRGEWRRSLAFFAHLTDTHIADEASPARHEQLYGRRPVFGGFWRPQEAFGPHVVDQTVRAVNLHTTSGLESAGGPARLGFALVTGDLADNAQVNEVRWAVRALDGGRLDPYSGRRISRANRCAAPPAVRRRLNRAVALRRYAGVARSRRALGPWPGVLARAQRPFVAEGLAVPWYSVRGNHDALPQGIYGPAVARPRSAPTGCRKLLGLRRPASGHPWDVLRRGLPSASFVPPDPRRRFLRSPGEFRRLHGRADHAHGFGFTAAAQHRSSRGAALYYAWSPRPELRFIALDTTADAGGADGNLDHPQYLWLARELRRARRRDQLVVVYGHHPLEMMGNHTPDELAGRFDRDPRDSRPLHLGRAGPASLRALLMRNTHVVLYVTGHKHYDRIWPNFRRDGRGFWQIITNALAGAPQEARLIEVMDNGDGSLSIFTTMLAHAAPATPPPPGPGAALDPAGLASIARSLAWSRRPGGRQAAGSGGPNRDIELIVRDPRRG